MSKLPILSTHSRFNTYSSMLWLSLSLFFLTAIGLVYPSSALAVACAPPEVGNYTLSESCTFANSTEGNAIDGVYQGNMIIPESTTLTINAGQTVCWYPGNSIELGGGSIAINATGQLKECNVVQEMLASIGFDTYAAGQPARVYSNNLFVCTSEPCVATAPSAAGNLVVEGTTSTNLMGIGTTNPSAALDLVGATMGIVINSSIGNAYIDLKESGTLKGNVWWDSSDDYMGINSTGNPTSINPFGGYAGVGTTAPKNKFQVTTGGADTAVPAAGTIDTATALYLTNYDYSYGLLSGVLATGNAWIQAQRTDTTATTYPLLLNPNGGNVGIGTTAPDGKLTIQAAASSGINTMETYKNSAGGTRFNFLYDATNVVYHIANLSSVPLFTVNGSNGRVGVNVSAPFGRLAIDEADATTTVPLWITTHTTQATDANIVILSSSYPGATDNEFRFKTNGIAYADTSWTGGGADVAEVYLIHGKSQPGDLVSIMPPTETNDPGKELSLSRGTTYDSQVVGVVSTFPGLMAAYGPDDEELTDDSPRKAVALAGRVPVKVNLENGVIKAGDFLTSSSTPGVAMKATKSGKVIGQALENYDGSVQLSKGVRIAEQDRLDAAWGGAIPKPSPGTGKIMLFVDPTWYTPEASDLEQRVTDLEEKLSNQ